LRYDVKRKPLLAVNAADKIDIGYWDIGYWILETLRYTITISQYPNISISPIADPITIHVK